MTRTHDQDVTLDLYHDMNKIGEDSNKELYGKLGDEINMTLSQVKWYLLSWSKSVRKRDKAIAISLHNSTNAKKSYDASNAPRRGEIVSKFVPSPDSDITRIDFHNGGSGSYNTDSNLSALGTD